MAETEAGTARTVVVTGASTGIGRACALHLDALGYVVFAGVRRPEDADALRQAASPRLVPTPLDVTVSRSVAGAAASVAEALAGRGLAGLVNNAGVAVAFPLELVALEDLRRQFEVNVVGQVAVTQAFLPLLRRSPGRVVNIGSVCGVLSLPLLGPYSASKFALEALTDSLRMELRPWNISVSIVEAGSIATPIWESSIRLAEKRYQDLPREARALYEWAHDRMRDAMRRTGRDGAPPGEVARAVERALEARRPRARYRVGTLATIGALGRWVPAPLRDLLIRRYLRL